MFRGIPVHRIDRVARINHDKRTGSPPDLPMRGARDNRDARGGRVAPAARPALWSPSQPSTTTVDQAGPDHGRRSWRPVQELISTPSATGKGIAGGTPGFTGERRPWPCRCAVIASAVCELRWSSDRELCELPGAEVRVPEGTTIRSSPYPHEYHPCRGPTPVMAAGARRWGRDADREGCDLGGAGLVPGHTGGQCQTSASRQRWRRRRRRCRGSPVAP